MFSFSFGQPAPDLDPDTHPPAALNLLVGVLARRSGTTEQFRLAVRALSEAQCEAHTYEHLMGGDLLRVKLVSGAHALDLNAVVMNVSPAESGENAWVCLLHFVHPTLHQRKILRNVVSRYGERTA